MGVDIAERRGCAWCLLDRDYGTLAAGWVDCDPDPSRTAESLMQVIKAVGAGPGTPVGIDAPRQPLPQGRVWRWSKKNGWTRSGSALRGRHCELIVNSLKLANPQWTPTRDAAPGWMRLGFVLFETLGLRYKTFEVFPSASYSLLDDRDTPRITIGFRSFNSGPKDMLDAYVGAATVGELQAGRGCEVGGGDGLGTIVLPRPIPDCGQLLRWPENQ